MAGLRASGACILIILIVSSGAASTGAEARRLLAETRAAEEEACGVGGCRRLPAAQGRAGLAAATTTKMATTDGRATNPGHSPGIGNKIAGNTR